MQEIFPSIPEASRQNIMYEVPKVKLQLILVLLLILPTMMAYQVNTTVTIDFVGGDQYYLRTESGDTGPYNITDQTDRSYMINITRLSATNQTDMEYISSMVTNLSKSCSNLTTYQTEKDRRCIELDANWTRCNLDKNALMAQVIDYESNKINQANTITQLQQSYTNQMNGLQNSYNTCTIALNNQTSSVQDLTKGKSNNLMLGLVIGAAIVGGLWLYQNSQKTRFNRPGEMRRFGFGGTTK
jgi:uncharacterized integral membrane protein